MTGNSGSEQVTPAEIRYQDIGSKLEEWIDQQIHAGEESGNLGGWKGHSGKRYDVLNRSWTGLGDRPSREIFIVATDPHPETGGLEMWRYNKGSRNSLTYQKNRIDPAKEPRPGREKEIYTVEGAGYNVEVKAETSVDAFDKFGGLLQDLGAATRFPPPSI